MNRTIRLFFALTCLLAFVGHRSFAATAPDSPCFKCHEAKRKSFSEGVVHPPVAEGDCAACHEDHGPANKLVLKEKVPKLCWGCHDEIKGKHLHPPVSDGECLLCHKIHSSPKKKLLAQGSPGLCYQCHDDFAKKATALHSPVAEGECMECHRPHQSDRDSLLAKDYSRERYVDFSKDAYALCFGCHDAKPFEDSAAADATQFRNGCTNLHFLHVVGKVEVNKYGLGKISKKRMSCNGCHLVHGSNQEKMIRRSLERDKMTLYSIAFKKTEGGGTCIVGCHKPQEYQKAIPEGISQASGTKAQCAPLKKAIN